MARVNEHFLELKSSYLFSEIARRVRGFQVAHPDARILRLGIGDVTRPLPPAVIEALHAAVDEMAGPSTFRGYGPEAGYDFLIDAIRDVDFARRGIDLARDEIFVSDGAKCDTGNFQELFAPECSVALQDPVYPVYVDSNVMAGRSSRLVYLPCTAENDFNPSLPDRPVDLVYLCYPNNPTGAAPQREALTRWVEYARASGAVILYDAAYEAYIRDPDLPRSIYEIPGAREVAVEFRSLSKTAGFTGTRCAYTVVPKEVTARTAAGEAVALNGLWLRRVSTKFNGVPYIIQRAAAAVFTEAGQTQVRALVDDYMENARLIREGLQAAGLTVYGGVHAPYIWLKTPGGLSSWKFFDLLLRRAHVVGTPGAGFGPSGEGYLRLTAFGGREQTEEAVERIRTRLEF